MIHSEMLYLLDISKFYLYEPVPFHKKHDLQKKHFTGKNIKRLLNYMLYKHDATCNLFLINNKNNDIYKKDQ